MDKQPSAVETPQEAAQNQTQTAVTAPHNTTPTTLGIISLCAWIIPFIGSVGGAILGIIGLVQSKKHGNGFGVSLAGTIVNGAVILLHIAAVVFFVFIIALAASESPNDEYYPTDSPHDSSVFERINEERI